MQRLGLSANLMTLGGLAIAIGGGERNGSLSAVVEDVYRHLAQNNGATRKSTSEVILRPRKHKPILFGILIISVIFLPLMTLHGMEEENVRAAGLHVGNRAPGLGRGHVDPIAGARIADLARRPSGGNAPHAMDGTSAMCLCCNGRSGTAVSS